MELPQGAQPRRHLDVGLLVSSMEGSKHLLLSAALFADVCHGSCGRLVRLLYMAGPGRDSRATNWWDPMSVDPHASRASVYALNTPTPPLVPAMPLGNGVASPRSSEPSRRPRGAGWGGSMWELGSVAVLPGQIWVTLAPSLPIL